MRLLFSESRADYDHYIFPYAVWAFPEPGESPAELFNRGFLPSSRYLDRFYLCRHVRVNLANFSPSSENRRILRKGEGLDMTLVPRAEFAYTPERREFYKRYADTRFGQNTLSYERLDSLFQSPITSHVLLFREAASGREVGVVTLYLEPPTLAYYYHAFYDLSYFARNLGMFMMTSSVAFFAEHSFRYLYLGSCYRPHALYKTQFAGAEFFNGVRWSGNLDELKHLVGRTQHDHHLLEDKPYLEEFYGADLAEIAGASAFRCSAP